MRRRATWLILLGVGALATALAWQWRERFFSGPATPPHGPAGGPEMDWVDRVGWLGTPGPLSLAHARLSDDCQACHVPFRRAVDAKCLACHAKNAALLSRKDTAFHAEATRCITCHIEHQGRAARISRMEHGVLNPEVGCPTCHVDRHQTFFGDRCTECHIVDTWNVRGFRHPSPRSRLCAECHALPPSHLMMHFQMVDQGITGQRDATVDQCWRCHATDHWNNIIGVGIYKHH